MRRLCLRQRPTNSFRGVLCFGFFVCFLGCALVGRLSLRADVVCLCECRGVSDDVRHLPRSREWFVNIVRLAAGRGNGGMLAALRRTMAARMVGGLKVTRTRCRLFLSGTGISSVGRTSASERRTSGATEATTWRRPSTSSSKVTRSCGSQCRPSAGWARRGCRLSRGSTAPTPTSRRPRPRLASGRSQCKARFMPRTGLAITCRSLCRYWRGVSATPGCPGVRRNSCSPTRSASSVCPSASGGGTSSLSSAALVEVAHSAARAARATLFAPSRTETALLAEAAMRVYILAKAGLQGACKCHCSFDSSACTCLVWRDMCTGGPFADL